MGSSPIRIACTYFCSKFIHPLFIYIYTHTHLEWITNLINNKKCQRRIKFIELFNFIHVFCFHFTNLSLSYFFFVFYLSITIDTEFRQTGEEIIHFRPILWIEWENEIFVFSLIRIGGIRPFMGSSSNRMSSSTERNVYFFNIFDLYLSLSLFEGWGN